MAVRPAALPRAIRAHRLPRPSGRLVVAAVAVVVLLGGGWLWLRDSSLVAVREVTVTGISGPSAAAVRSALIATGQDMTTLNVDEGALRSAVARYPVVASLSASPDVPHGLRIAVRERVPVGAIDSGSMTVAVAGDGTLLRDVPVSGLPAIVTKLPPGGARVSDRKTVAKVELLAAAPARLRARIQRVTLGPYGLTARLDQGPVLRFGDGRRLHAKWEAARRVMLEPGSSAATYLDLRVPERPAAGGLTEAQGGAPQSLLTAGAEDQSAGTETAVTDGSTAGP